MQEQLDKPNEGEMMMFVVALTVESETDDMEIDIDEACSVINRALAELAQTENVGGGSLGRFGAWGDLQASVRPLSEIMSC